MLWRSEIVLKVLFFPVTHFERAWNEHELACYDPQTRAMPDASPKLCPGPGLFSVVRFDHARNFKVSSQRKIKKATHGTHGTRYSHSQVLRQVPQAVAGRAKAFTKAPKALKALKALAMSHDAPRRNLSGDMKILCHGSCNIWPSPVKMQLGGLMNSVLLRSTC